MAWYDSFMPHQTVDPTMPNGGYGMPPQQGMQGVLSGNNPLFNIGMGILANNTGNYGAFAPAIGRGLSQGIQQTQQARQLEQQQKLEEMRLKQYEAALKRQQREDEREAKLEGILGGAFKPGGEVTNPAWSFMDASQAATTEQPYTTPQTIQQNPSFDLQSVLPQIMQVDPQRGLALYQQFQKQEAPIRVSKGETLLNPSTYQPVFSAPEEPKYQIAPNGQIIDMNNPDTSRSYAKEDLPAAVQEYNFARGQGYRGSFNDYQLSQRRAGASSTNVNYGAPVAGVDASGNPVFFQPSKGGGAPAIVPGVRPEPKPEKAPTESQAKAGTFYSQMVSASDELGTLSREGFDPTSLGSQASTGLATGITNPLAGQAAQRARQAQEQWSESFLRVKTGAAATQDEVDRNIRTFFPKIGDSPAVIAQKARARKKAEQDVLNMAAPEMKRAVQQPEQAPRVRRYNPKTGKIE